MIAGKHVGRVIDWRPGSSPSGAERIEITLVTRDGESIYADLYVNTDKVFPRTVETLKVCGWDGRDFGTLDGIGTVDVEIVVADEVYDGVSTPKVKWINPLGGRQGPMDSEQKRSFAARMNAKLKQISSSSTKATSTSAQRAPAQRQTQPPSPPPIGDDDLPF